MQIFLANVVKCGSWDRENAELSVPLCAAFATQADAEKAVAETLLANLIDSDDYRPSEDSIGGKKVFKDEAAELRNEARTRIGTGDYPGVLKIARRMVDVAMNGLGSCNLEWNIKPVDFPA